MGKKFLVLVSVEGVGTRAKRIKMIQLSFKYYFTDEISGPGLRIPRLSKISYSKDSVYEGIGFVPFNLKEVV